MTRQYPSLGLVSADYQAYQPFKHSVYQVSEEGKPNEPKEPPDCCYGRTRPVSDFHCNQRLRPISLSAALRNKPDHLTKHSQSILKMALPR